MAWEITISGSECGFKREIAFAQVPKMEDAVALAQTWEKDIVPRLFEDGLTNISVKMYPAPSVLGTRREPFAGEIA